MYKDLMGTSSIFSKSYHGKLFHHSRSFIGCFSIHARNNINWPLFLNWKMAVDQDLTKGIALSMSHFIINSYDYIKTAPPSARRDLNNYCCFKLCEEISKLVGIPFIVSFAQRENKKYHGVHPSLSASAPEFIDNFNIEDKKILWVDDFITSGRTAKWCFELLRGENNHVDGLIFSHWKVII